MFNSEMRRKVRFIEQTQEEVVQTLGGDVVRKYLSEEYADTLQVSVEHMYVPNFKNNVISPPRKYQEADCIPIIALDREEAVGIAPSLLGFTPHQVGQLAKRFKGWRGDESNFDPLPAIEAVNRMLEDMQAGETYPLCLGQSAGQSLDGSTHTSTIGLGFDRAFYPYMGKEDARIFRGRPIVMLGMHLQQETPRPLSCLVHETVHALQVAHEPATSVRNSEDDKYRRELEAYHTGAIYGVGVYDTASSPHAGNSLLLNDLAIETLRSEHALKADPFYPTRILKQALDEAGIDIVQIK